MPVGGAAFSAWRPHPLTSPAGLPTSFGTPPALWGPLPSEPSRPTRSARKQDSETLRLCHVVERGGHLFASDANPFTFGPVNTNRSAGRHRPAQFPSPIRSPTPPRSPCVSTPARPGLTAGAQSAVARVRSGEAIGCASSVRIVIGATTVPCASHGCSSGRKPSCESLPLCPPPPAPHPPGWRENFSRRSWFGLQESWACPGSGPGE